MYEELGKGQSKTSVDVLSISLAKQENGFIELQQCMILLYH